MLLIIMIFLQRLPKIALFFSTLLWDLNLLKYWWSITHSLPRHGRFWYLKETITKSQCCTQQTLLKSDVKNEDTCNIWQYLVKMKEKLHFVDKIFNFKRKILLFNEFLMFWGFENCPWCDFYHVWSSFNLNFCHLFPGKSM